MPDVAALSDLDLPRRHFRVGRRTFSPDGKDRGLATMLVGTSWLLAALPGAVIPRQRQALIDTLQGARNLVVEIECSPAVLVRVRDGRRVLVEIPAT